MIHFKIDAGLNQARKMMNFLFTNVSSAHITFIVGRNFCRTSSLLSSIVLLSNKLIKKKKDAVAAGP